MAERKTYTAEDFKGCNGRRVLVEGVVSGETLQLSTVGNIRLDFVSKCPSDTGINADYAYVSPSAIVEILPEEIRSGDKVATTYGVQGVVRCIDGEQAWVKFVEGCGTVRLSDLTLVERG